LRLRGRAGAAGLFLVALAVCGWFEARMAPFGLSSSVVTFSVAAAVLSLSAISTRRWRSEPSLAPQSPVGTPARLRGYGLAAWVLVAGLVVAVELWELFHSPRSFYPTLSSLANGLIGPGHRIGRAAAFVCWAVCGLVVSERPRCRR
jgi:polyferredoxin